MQAAGTAHSMAPGLGHLFVGVQLMAALPGQLLLLFIRVFTKKKERKAAQQFDFCPAPAATAAA